MRETAHGLANSLLASKEVKAPLDIIKKEDNALSLEVCSPKEIEGIKFVFQRRNAYGAPAFSQVPRINILPYTLYHGRTKKSIGFAVKFEKINSNYVFLPFATVFIRDRGDLFRQERFSGA